MAMVIASSGGGSKKKDEEKNQTSSAKETAAKNNAATNGNYQRAQAEKATKANSTTSTSSSSKAKSSTSSTSASKSSSTSSSSSSKAKATKNNAKTNGNYQRAQAEKSQKKSTIAKDVSADSAKAEQRAAKKLLNSSSSSSSSSSKRTGFYSQENLERGKTQQQLNDEAAAYEKLAQAYEKQAFTEAKGKQSSSNIFDIFNNAYKAVSGISDDSAALSAAQKNEDAQKWRGKSAEASYLAEQARQSENAESQSEKMADVNSLSDEERNIIEKYIATDDTNWYSRLNPTTSDSFIWSADSDPASQLSGLVEKYGQDAVDEMVETVRRENDEEASAAATEAGEKFGNEHGVLASIGAAVSSPFNMISEGLQAVRNFSLGKGSYDTLNTNGTGHLNSDFWGSATNTVSDNIQNNLSLDTYNKLLAGINSGLTGQQYEQSLKQEIANSEAAIAAGEDPTENARKTMATLYDAGEEVAQNWIRTILFGPFSLAIMGVGAFGSAVREASQKGATPEQAALIGVLDAGIEVISEFTPLDDLLSIIGGDGQSAADVVKTVLKEAGIEASTEEASLLGETLVEMAVLQGKSSYTQTIGKLVHEGMSYEEAKAQANKDILDESIQTMVVSGLSGGLSSAGASIYANIRGGKESSLFGGIEQEEKAANDRDIADAIAQGESYEDAKAQVEQRQTDAAAATQQETVQPAAETADVQSNAAAQTQTADAGTQALNDYVQRAQSGETTLTNREAANILSSPAALQVLQQETGLELSGVTDENGNPRNDSTNRKAVKEAVRQYQQKQATNELANTLLEGIAPQQEAAQAQDTDAIANQLLEGIPSAQQEQAVQQEATPQDTALQQAINQTLGIQQEQAPAQAEQPVQRQTKSPEYTAAVGKDKIANIVSEYKGEPVAPKKTKTKAKTAEQATTTETVETGTPVPQANYTGTEAYENLLSDDNVQRSRADDVRNVEAPVVNAEGRKVSEFVGNALGSNLTPDSFTATIEKIVGEGGASHEVLTNQQALKDAAKEISDKGIVKSLSDIRDTAFVRKETGAKKVAEATLLYRYLVQDTSKGGQDLAADAFSSLAQLATNSGQSLQLFSMFRQMTPEGQLGSIQNDINRYVEKMKRNGKIKQDYEVTISSELQEEYIKAAKEMQKAKTPAEIDKAKRQVKAAQDAMYAQSAAQMPVTFRQKWDSWRYMCMLGNAKTQIRNFAGNLGFVPYAEVKRTMAAAFEKALPKEQRTKSLTLADKTGQELLEWAKTDRNSVEVSEALGYSAKLGDVKDIATGKMQDNLKVFNNKTLEKFRQIFNWAPNAGDMLFKSKYYERALAGFIKARGYTVADINNGTVSETTLMQAREYALNDAMKNTFNDSNGFSDMVSSLGFKNADTWWKRAANVIGEGVLPFKRTPANVLVRAVEYSPAGIVKSLYDFGTKVQSGDMTAATAIDELCAGLTGTGAIALGAMLSNMGVLTGASDDEDDERQGKQSYSLNILGGSYPIDWAAPANLPLFVGAEIAKMLRDNGGDSSVSTLTAIMSATNNISAPLLELSCLSGLNDALQSSSYATQNGTSWIVAFATQAAVSYITQGIPSLVRQGENTLHENKQETFANSSDPYIRSVQRTLGNVPILGDVLGLRQDAVDEWGNTEYQGNLLVRAVNNFLNPGTYKEIDTSAKEQEISRLNGVQETNVSPQAVDKTISYTDADGNYHKNERLTQEQYRTMEEVQGQTSDELVTKLIDSDVYKTMSDSTKAEIINKLYDYAEEKARIAAIDDYVDDDSISELSTDELISKAIQDEITSEFSSALKTVRQSGTDGVDELASAYKTYSGLSDSEKEAFKESASGRTVDYLNAKDAGIDDSTFATAYKKYMEIDDSDVSASQKAQDWSIYLADQNDKGNITDAQEKTLRENMTYYSGFAADAGKVNDIVDAGFSAAVAKTVDDLLDSYPENDDIDKRRAAVEGAKQSGLSDEETDKLVKLYMKDYDPDAEKKDYTELKYDYIRANGYSAEDYINAYQAYLDESSSKRASKIAAIEEAGYTNEEARFLYSVYHNDIKDEMVDWYNSGAESSTSTSDSNDEYTAEFIRKALEYYNSRK